LTSSGKDIHQSRKLKLQKYQQADGEQLPESQIQSTTANATSSVDYHQDTLSKPTLENQDHMFQGEARLLSYRSKQRHIDCIVSTQ